MFQDSTNKKCQAYLRKFGERSPCDMTITITFTNFYTDSINTPDGNIVITVAKYDMGQFFKTLVSIRREWQDDSMRQFDIPHSSPFLDPMIVREFYLTILEWGIDCL